MATGKNERAAIVAWLRESAAPLSVVGDKKHILEAIAVAIERGDHLTQQEKPDA